MIHITHPNIPVTMRAAFAQKVKDIAAYLVIDPNWLMQVMYAESKLNHQAKNIQQGRLIAAGLLQWTKASGVAPLSVLRLNPIQQLEKVKEYFTPYRGKMHSYFDVYLVTFFPLGMGKADDYVFATNKLSAALIAKQNPAINKNKDGKITMAEFKQYVWNSTPVSVRDIVFQIKQVIKTVQKAEQKVVAQVKVKAKQVQEKVTHGIRYAKDNEDTINKAMGGIGAALAFFYSFNM